MNKKLVTLSSLLVFSLLFASLASAGYNPDKDGVFGGSTTWKFGGPGSNVESSSSSSTNSITYTNTAAKSHSSVSKSTITSTPTYTKATKKTTKRNYPKGTVYFTDNGYTHYFQSSTATSNWPCYNRYYCNLPTTGEAYYYEDQASTDNPTNWRNKQVFNQYYYSHEGNETYWTPYYYTPQWDEDNQQYNWRF